MEHVSWCPTIGDNPRPWPVPLATSPLMDGPVSSCCRHHFVTFTATFRLQCHHLQFSGGSGTIESMTHLAHTHSTHSCRPTIRILSFNIVIHICGTRLTYPTLNPPLTTIALPLLPPFTTVFAAMAEGVDGSLHQSKPPDSPTDCLLILCSDLADHCCLIIRKTDVNDYATVE